MTEATHANYIIEHLEGEPCQHCEGTLERSTYKDNDAVVCDGCGTPRAQLFGADR